MIKNISPEHCPVCNGDGVNRPCAYPGEMRIGCLRDIRRREDKTLTAASIRVAARSIMIDMKSYLI